MKMDADFILERLEVFAGSASEKESGNETAERMFSYLDSHKEGNENEIKTALNQWKESGDSFKAWISEYLLETLELA